MTGNKMHKVARTARRSIHNKFLPPRRLDYFKLIAWFAAIVLLWGIIIGTIYYVVQQATEKSRCIRPDLG
jgi:hypothetical protein